MPTEALEIKVEKLIEGFRTEKGKKRAIIDAVNHNLTDKPEYLEMAMQHLLSVCNPLTTNAYSMMAEYALRMGDTDKATNFYLQSGYYREGIKRVASLIKEKGDIKKAINLIQEHIGYETALQYAAIWEGSNLKGEIYEQIIQECRNKNPGLAAYLARKNGDYERAIQINLEQKNYWEAAQIADENLNDTRRALQFAELSPEGGDFAIAYAQKLGDKDKLRQVYEKEIKRALGFNNFKWAVELAERIEDKKGAEQFYALRLDECLKKGKFSWAAEMAEKLGRLEQAKELIAKSLVVEEEYVDYTLLARGAEKIGDIELSRVYKEFSELVKR